MYIADLQKSLTLTKMGVWLHEGTPVTHKRTIELFNRSIVWIEDECAYFLQIGKGRARFSCEDTAYFVRELRTDNDPWEIRLADGTTLPLRPETLSFGAEDQLYCLVRGGHRARFSRPAFQTLTEHIDEDGNLVMGDQNINLCERLL